MNSLDPSIELSGFPQKLVTNQFSKWVEPKPEIIGTLEQQLDYWKSRLVTALHRRELEGIIVHPEMQLSKLSLLTEAERRQLSLPTPLFYVQKGLRYFVNETLRLLAKAVESLILKPTYFQKHYYVQAQ